MDIGFETTGNATVVVHDGGPLLVTDPWLVGSPYFGSWTLSHTIPDEVRAHIDACPYIWISHGHPDHLSPESLELLPGKPILLPDHYGGRVAQGLREMGREVRVMKDGEWLQLGERTRICCVGDVFQDAVLLIDVDGHLIVDSNDAADRGVGEFVRAEVAKRDDTYLTALTGYGDADMIHFFDEDGQRILPGAARKEPPGPGIHGILEFTGIRRYVPFSTMHHYQREDSAWANEYATGPADFPRGFPEGTDKEMLPAFCRVDFATGEVGETGAAPAEVVIRPSTDFGDDWSEELEADEVERVRAYLGRFDHLRTFLGFVRFVVGGKEHVVDVNPEFRERGVTFRAPRGSLMTSVDYRIFDDLLIGNFMSTTLHGPWAEPAEEALYPDFNPFVTKFGDNGGAHTPDELRAYFAEYERRGFFGPGPSPMGAKLFEAIAPYHTPQRA